jgi:polyhydroxyalkanoate synthesis regulator phasin
MEDTLKKVLYTGVGLVSDTIENVKKTVDEMVKKGDVSQEHGKKIVDGFTKKYEHGKDDVESRLRTMVNGALEKLNLPKADEVEKLEKRIKSLEVKVGLLNKELDKMEKANGEDEEPKKTTRAKH